MRLPWHIVEGTTGGCVVGQTDENGLNPLRAKRTMLLFDCDASWYSFSRLLEASHLTSYYGIILLLCVVDV